MNFNILYVFLLYLAILIHIVSARYDANITRKKPRDIDYEEEQLLQISTDSCYDVTHIAYSGDQEPQFNFFPSSVSCVDTEETYIRELGDVSAFCPPGLVDLKVEPVAILKGTGSYPTMNLKITANVFSKVEAIFIRLQCIESPDAEDTYCHDKSKMTNNGRWIHPCRGIQFKGEKEVDYPLTFGYACFRLFGLTHTMVNVTVFPQNCRQTIDFAAPRDTKLFPEIRRFYAKPNPQEQKRSTWSPMLEVDLRDPDGVWFRLEGPDEGYRAVDEVELLIYENMARVKSLTEPVLKLREIFHLRYPQRSVKWSAAKAGSYFVHAKTAFGGCQDTCKGQPEDCHVCSFITHNFNIDRPFMTIGNKVVRFAVDYIWVMVGVLTVLVILIAIFGFGLTWRMRQKAIHAANNPKTMELTEYSETLLIYADDCPEERTVIEELFKCLQSDAAARVFVDSEELNYIGAQPGLWLANCFCSVDKVLLIMSPCVPEMIAIKDRKVLKQERPYPDCLFPGYNMIVNACTSMVNNPAIRGKQASAKDQKEPLIAKSPQHRFAIVRFHFSPPTPPQLQVLGLSEFELPKEFPLLTAFLHNLDSKEYIFGQNLSVENEMSLMSAVCAMSEKTFGNTNWKEERWEREENLRKGELHELKPAVRAPMETHGEMEKVAESYSILPPDNEAEEVTTTAETFNLLPPDSDGEDTESENDDEEPKKSPDSTPTLKKKLIASDKQKDQKIVTQLVESESGSMDLKNGRITPIGTSTSTS